MSGPIPHGSLATSKRLRPCVPSPNGSLLYMGLIGNTATPSTSPGRWNRRITRPPRKYPSPWLDDPIPHLATLVSASPFDAALHDAFGKVHGLNCYSTYGADFLSHDLGHFLGKEYGGLWLHQFIDRKAKPRMPLYHLVGALDPLTSGEVKQPVGDGLPETLGEWIYFDGLTHLKIKLNGEDLDWDVERVLGVNRVAEEVQAKRGVVQWFYSLDFNEKCANVGYLLDFLKRIKERSPSGFERIQYIEQPTRRD